MSQNFEKLADHLQPLLQRLSSAERSKLAKKIGRDLRNSQKKRITEQKNTDGSSYTPRRKRLREKKGRIKRKMFSRLKSNTHLKLLSNADAVAIGFIGRVSRIANVHQNGLRDRAERGAPDVVYPTRELLGLTNHEIKQIEDSFLKHINI